MRVYLLRYAGVIEPSAGAGGDRALPSGEGGTVVLVEDDASVS